MFLLCLLPGAGAFFVVRISKKKMNEVLLSFIVITGYLLTAVMIFWFQPWAYHKSKLEIQGDLQFDTGDQDDNDIELHGLKDNEPHALKDKKKVGDNICENEYEDAPNVNSSIKDFQEKPVVNANISQNELKF